MQDLKLVVKSRGDDNQPSEDDVKGVVYGREVDSTPISANFQQLDKLFAEAGTNQLVELEIEGGKTHNVLFKEVQFDPVSNEIRHFDLYAVKKGEKLQASVPVTLVGESPAVIKGATLTQVIESVDVECIPSKLPEVLELDVSSLNEVGDALHVSDLKVDEDVAILVDAEQTVVKADEVKELEVEDTSGVVDDGEAVEGEAEEGEESGGDEAAESGDEAKEASE